MHRRRVLDRFITLGLDVHKDTIAVALAEAGRDKDVREYGKIANTATALNALAAKLSRAGTELRFCYAGPPLRLWHSTAVEPDWAGLRCRCSSLIPRKPGDLIRADRRDAINLAKLHRAELPDDLAVPSPPRPRRCRLPARCDAPRGAFRTVADLQAAINRFLEEQNRQSQPFAWTVRLRHAPARVGGGAAGGLCG